jgi:hypothetical protein
MGSIKMKITFVAGSSDDLCILRDAIQDKYHELKQKKGMQISKRRKRLATTCQQVSQAMTQAISHNRDMTIEIEVV